MCRARRVSGRLLIGLAAAWIGLACLAAGVPPAAAQTGADVYEEDFEDGEAQGWEMDPQHWVVVRGALRGAGPGRALYVPVLWQNMQLTFNLIELTDTLLVSLHVTDGQQWTIVVLENYGETIGVALQREYAPDAGGEELARGEFSLAEYGFDRVAQEGLPVEISVDGGIINVLVGKQPVINYREPEPPPAGRIAFETLEGSSASIAFITVYGPQLAPPADAPPQREGDLVLAGYELLGFEDGGERIVFGVRVLNAGPGTSPPVDVTLMSEDGRSIRAAVEPIPPREERFIQLALDVLDGWRGTEQRFYFELDPDGLLNDVNRDNNYLETALIAIPGGPEEPPVEEPPPVVTPELPGAPRWLGLVIALGGAGLLAVAAAAVTLTLVIRAGQRRRWERQAREQEPPDTCRPGERTCEVETEVDLRRMRVSRLEWLALEPGSEHLRRRQAVTGDLPARLDRLIRARLRGEQPESIAAGIDALAVELAGPLAAFAHQEQAPLDLAARAHLEGIEVELTFTLYRCTGSPPNCAWKRVARWKKKEQRQRDDVIAALAGVNPADRALVQRLPGVVSQRLRQFVESYRPAG